MSTVTEWMAGADSLPEIPVPRGDRIEDVERKHESVTQLLKACECDALLLLDPASISWFTSGGDFQRTSDGQTRGAIFVTPEARVVVTDNVDSVYLFEEVVPHLGFQLKERPWTQPREGLLSDLCRGRRIACDQPLPKVRDVGSELRLLRSRLTALDRERMRVLGRLVVHAVEATARQAKVGMTECEIAGELAHRLVKRRVRPQELRVSVDGFNSRFRRAAPGDRPFQNMLVCGATASRWGLTLSVNRTMSWGEVPDSWKSSYDAALLMLATGLHFSQSGWVLGEIWKRVQRIYEKFGFPHEWTLAEQGAVIGNRSTEVPLVPESTWMLERNMAVRWMPSVGPASLCESILVTDSAPEWLTSEEAWPTRLVEVKGQAVRIPSILTRQVAE